jgi:hypothetical protein
MYVSCSGESNLAAASIQITPRYLIKFEKIGYESGSKVGTFDEKTEVENLALLSLEADNDLKKKGREL